MFRKFSDRAIIDGVRSQDDDVLNWIYDNYLETVRHHVLKNSGSEEDVSDVFQESIISLYQQITEDNLDLTTDLKGYFFSIARNIWSNNLRKNVRNVVIDIDPPDEIEPDGHDNLLLEKIVSRAFQKLSADSQDILTFFAEGYSYTDIASKMNLKNESYARRKKYLSKEALMELLKEDPEYHEFLDLK